ncbi:MAG: methyl-accepting chemotaxis protein, partial [Leptospiraceae bacterium]|nr:methyl-accepting chemotaxis protein [Leptospiraceae bacterium]
MFKSLLFKVIFSVAISIFIIELIIGLFSVSSRKKQLILSKTESFQLTTEALEDDILDFYPKEQEKILIRLQHLSQNLGLTCIQLYSDTQKTLLSTCPTVDTKFYPSGFSDNIMISKDEDLIRYKINLKQNNSLSLIYDFPNAQFIKETKKYALNIVALVGIIIAFVTLIMSFILYLIILKPIISIKQQIAHSLDQGHIDLTTKIQNHSKDELGEITNFFNLYIEKVHSFIVHAIETYRELKERIQSLHKLTNKIHEGSEKVLESTKKITGDAESQNKELGSIQQSIKNMENEISSLYEIADDSGEHAKKTLQTIAIAQKQG